MQFAEEKRALVRLMLRPVPRLTDGEGQHDLSADSSMSTIPIVEKGFATSCEHNWLLG